MKSDLIQSIRNKGLHLKIDGCTRHFKRFFAVNVQYFDGEKVTIKTLAVRCTEQNSHTGTYIKRCVTLFEYFQLLYNLFNLFSKKL